MKQRGMGGRVAERAADAKRELRRATRPMQKLQSALPKRRLRHAASSDSIRSLSQRLMNVDDMLKSPALKKAAVTFATGYARRMMEGQYTRLMNTELGKQASRLSKPSKYAVEAVLNGIVAPAHQTPSNRPLPKAKVRFVH